MDISDNKINILLDYGKNIINLKDNQIYKFFNSKHTSLFVKLAIIIIIFKLSKDLITGIVTFIVYLVTFILIINSISDYMQDHRLS